jgi:hypothetical protein
VGHSPSTRRQCSSRISEPGTLQTLLLTGQILFHVIVLSGRIGLPAWNTHEAPAIHTHPTH